MVCAKCKKEILDTPVKFKGKSYHSSCHAAMIEQAKKKNIAVSAKVNDPAHTVLIQYICSLFSLTNLSPLIAKQLDEFHNQRGYSWESIQLALKYFFELIPHEELETPTIGIVPFIYDEAMQYWETVKEARQANASYVSHEVTKTLPYHSKSSALKPVCNIEDL